MANSLPWSVKGIDPRTRDAAKAAARRAGMTLGEWLDAKIRLEAAEDAEAAGAPAPEQLDIAALSERLARLSGGRTDTAAPAATPAARPDSREIENLLRQAERTERLTRGQNQRTADALDSITRWIERTESRLAQGERTVAERQDRATSLIAEAIKTMGERLAEIERRGSDPRPVAASRSASAPRLAFSREGLQAAVTDIRTRQQILDGVGDAAPRTSASPDQRIAALRDDLRELGARLGHTETRRPAAAPAPQPPANDALVKAIEGKINQLGERLERLDRRDHFEPVLKPLARIEAEVTRLSHDRGGEAYQRFEREIGHLAAKIDALAQRGDGSDLAPLLRDMAHLRQIAAAGAGAQDGKLEELSDQISTLHFEVARLREGQPDPRELRQLSSAIDDMRGVALAGQSRDVLSAPLAELGARLDGFARKLDSIAKHRPDDYIEGRIDALQARLDRMAEEGPAAITRQIDALAERIDGLAATSRASRLLNEDSAAVDLGPIESMLQRLADKIDEAGAPGANSDSFEALEQQISGLAARLDEAAASRQTEGGIERTLQDLVVHLRSMREESAAERAALVQASTTSPGRGLAELSSLVSGLRDTQVSSERQTQDTLGAVHHTLEAIMGRLASLESELVADRRAARQQAIAAPGPSVPPAEPAPAPKAAMAAQMREQAGLIATAEDRAPIAVPASARVEPSLELPMTAFDVPLEPGSGRPRPEVPTTAAQDAQSIRQSLIAAARRSAKAASEAATSPAPAASEPTGKAPGKLGEIMAKRKRPLLLALAAVILAMGTAHVVTGALRGDAAKTAHNEAPIVLPPAEAPEAAEKAQPSPPPGTKDQSSLAAGPADKQAAAVAAPDPALLAAPAAVAAAEPVPAALQPAAPPTATEPVQAVTALGELPNGLGSPGLRKAAQEGDARAVYELASRAADGPSGQRDPKVALRLFERAAVAGLAPAQFRVGNMFEKGIGTQRDLSLARVWYERAADRGNAKAMHNLAVLYAEGATGKADYATATQWFAKAAELGVRDSQYNLAVLLGRGLGAPLDLGQSYLWFSVAASQGDEDAAKKRDEVAQRLKPEELAAAKARTASWRPKALEAAANEVAPPAKGWDVTPTATAPKPAKPARS